MNLLKLQKKLFAAARSNPPSDAVPYAFEKRIMARLQTTASADIWTLWSRGLWRAAATCIVVTLISGGWSMWAIHHDRSATEFADEFETAVFVMADQADQADESW